MHEMGIAISIVEIVEDSIPESMRDRTVEAVVVEIGRLSTVVPESLRFCFSVTAQDSVCNGAELDILEIPLTLSCRTCSHGWDADEPAFFCPSCDGIDIQINTGRELAVRTIRVADEPCTGESGHRATEGQGKDASGVEGGEATLGKNHLES